MRAKRPGNSGFTLIEVMIVVVIVGILASIAYPLYTNQVIRGERSDGQAALMSVAQRMERMYTRDNEYSVPGNLTSDQGLWEVDVSLQNNNQGFRLEADKVSGRDDSDCDGTMFLTHTGERGPDACW
ncbi:type IV pilin protein [Alkalilimnicola ehrlichii MLHE-1]|uniref:Pilus assembly protein n=1 Tax=Alkalilimnicola ehrlichii (strain ATCC BAA-1101 / DSM 17681 / MLHE-1) TaxID=187272 RepID=Q0AAC8_ALKEH|nr:type IV pilin protein [Alkalilimnicola ehrlichii]ABI56209.1 pilus assembly protein [Alkalilimnicola ehrlichii MLHE-1]